MIRLFFRFQEGLSLKGWIAGEFWCKPQPCISPAEGRVFPRCTQKWCIHCMQYVGHDPWRLELRGVLKQFTVVFDSGASHQYSQLEIRLRDVW
ncbi:Uncharacterized protein HZ326_2701 [Fusarium oxysporum f. sp. albedinis]|nr:Uncharacterized protein HZ326_2701 [Fusarium oxysporum f. sp. albedinis]